MTNMTKVPMTVTRVIHISQKAEGFVAAAAKLSELPYAVLKSEETGVMTEGQSIDQRIASEDSD